MRTVEENPRAVLKLVIPEFWNVDVRTAQNNLPLPDFDDTGFIGRHDDRKQVMHHLLSPHPIVTIVGEGGAGKTALALRCLYDLLERPARGPFDAIIWVSLKTKILTPQGVRDIQQAVTSGLGLVKTATAEIGTLESETHDLEALIERLRLDLADFHILLAIDNLETISWEPLRPLLSEIPSGSKILITSRVGLGELEIRYPIRQLDAAAAAILARKYAKHLNLKDIFEAKEITLRSYCQRLHYNPLLIRWFISSLASGASPAILLDKAGIAYQAAIQFCFENLFTRLSNIETEICHILASASRPLTQPELYFLTEHLDHDDVDLALNKLHQSSIVTRSFAGRADLPATQYALSDIASDYLTTKAPPPKRLFQRVQDRLKLLRGIIQSQSVQRSTYKYDMYAIRAATRDEQVTAVYLKQALLASAAENWSKAAGLVADAKRALPAYSEVYRIGGIIEAKRSNMFQAESDHQTAIECDEKSVIARYTYAQFLLNESGDYEKAVQQLNVALSLDQEIRHSRRQRR